MLRPDLGKHGLTLRALGDESPLGEKPQWNADRRAAPSSVLPRMRGRMKVGAVPRASAEVSEQRLSAFRFLF